MRDRSSSDLSHPAEAPSRPRFRRSLLGYSRRGVDEAMLRAEQELHELEDEVVQLREELMEVRHEASETRHDLTRARAELRYWNDRASYVDSEVARARQRAAELEETARQRAEAIEADAQERSLQLVDRVCAEANAMLQHAREEAREMFLRFEHDVDLSQQKLEKLEEVRGEVARTMQAALMQFEDAVRELDKVGPVRRIVESLEEPMRRPVPTFGQQKAQDAARRFEDAADRSASAALTSSLDERPAHVAQPAADASEAAPAGLSVTDPLPEVDAAAGDEVVAAAGDEVVAGDGAGDSGGHRRTHAADEEFASLLLNP